MSDLLSKDSATNVVKRATDILFIMNPKGTSMGVLSGIVINGLVEIFNPLLKAQKALDFTRIGTIYYLLFGVFVFNLPSAFRRHSLDPQIESALDSIKKAKREHNISSAQARIMYLGLYERVLAQIVLDKDTREKIHRLESLSNDSGNTPE
jgi:hypothetical protein